MTALAPRPARALLAAIVAAAALLTGCLLAPGDTRAARGLELAIQDDSLFVQGNSRWPGDRAFEYARAIGVTRIRVNLLWAYTMPESQYDRRTKPDVINYNFTQIDQLIDRAAANGIRIHLSLTGPAPRWANARKRDTTRAWFKPNPRQYGEFVDVVANHFKGRIDRYSIWNEPNYLTWLGPLKASPGIYRKMYVRGYRAIKKADRKAAVLIGETSPYKAGHRSTAPLAWLRKVLCVNKRYKRRGGCPRLKADGYAHHPYDFTHSPRFQFRGSDNVTIGTLSRLTRALDKLKRSGALRKTGGGRMPVYLTEYGYFATGGRAVSPRKRKRFLKQAYNIALRNGRVKSQLQYLLLVLPRGSQSTFNTGLVTRRGKRLAQYNALRSWYRGHRGRVKRPGGPISLPPAPPNPSR